jgi:hypothetical protein
MKKNLRNILALALGLMTTVSFAQDMNVDSRTRIDMGGEGDRMSTSQRITVGTNWGGENWGIVLSSDVNYTTNDGTNASMLGSNLNANVFEAYATTDLFGFATMNIGRQALQYGSGNIIGQNDWNANRKTMDGMTFAIDNDLVGLDLGLNSASGDNASMGSLDEMWLNASKASGDWSANLLYLSQSVNDGEANTWMGLDFVYSAMGGQLDLNASYNTSSFNANDGAGIVDGDMMDISGTYNVSDGMSLTAGMNSIGESGYAYSGLGNMQTTYGSIDEDGLEVSETFSGFDSNGNLGMLGPNDENLYIGGTYNMGDFSLSATMHTITNTELEGERKVSDITVGYSLNDNAGLSYRMVNDDNGGEGAETLFNWLTLTVTP